MIIDDVQITVRAGNGGNGLVTFSRTKMTQGPTGGNGGNGGSVYIEGVSDLSALRQFRFKKNIKAENGGAGKSQLNDGGDAKDLVLYVPVGTIARIIQTNSAIWGGRSIEIKKIGQRELIAKGGRGGKGNYLFRSATDTSPRKYEEGKPGESFNVRFELKMIADVGFIGLPNVGKSSLLNEITNAKSKVANYPFTTLEPNLGVYFELILADIPGLIEGASEGKGLGTKFLRHIERTKILFHFISAESKDPIQDYSTVRIELESYSPLLSEKPEHIFISKSDTVSLPELKEIENKFRKIKKEATLISIIDEASLNNFKKILNQLISEKQVS
ncbi:MAG: GTPase ObgE [Candidatus Staskawiczbacteria bacterium]|nr:GTPase ObgE [Candidatus Staskawiczbacteria bacterium]